MKATRALIVDDDTPAMEVLRGLLEKCGVNACLVDDPRDFPTAYRAFMPELIFLELGMEQIDGIELLKFLGRRESKALIVMVSGSPNSLVEVAHRLGREWNLDMAKPVSKPIDINLLRESINERGRSADAIQDLGITEMEISDAIAQDQFCLDYQPKIDLVSRDVVGVEGQLRWQHPKHGRIHAEQFLSAMANTGQLDLITNTVLARAIQDTDDWCEFVPELSVAIKISLASLRNPNLPERLERTVKSRHCEPGSVIFKVTNFFDETPDDLQSEVMTQLRLKGFRFSIDEFGLETSRLLKLKGQKDRSSELTIDASAICDPFMGDYSRASFQTIVSVAHRIGINVVATNIEDDATYDWLEDAGCNIGQGRHICPALPPGEMTEWLAFSDLSYLNRTLTPGQLKITDIARS